MALPAYVRKGTTQSAVGDFTKVTAGTIATTGINTASVSAAVTARAGGTKALATPLTSKLNYISVCATTADSVLLPPAVVGAEIFVFNAGAASAQVFGAGTDTIDGVATGTGVPLAATKRAIFICFTAGAWVSAQLGVVSA